MRDLTKAIISTLLLLLFTTAYFAQNSSVRLSIPVVLSDKKNVAVGDFSEKDISIMDSEKRLRIVSLEAPNRPFSIGILVDLSGSIGDSQRNKNIWNAGLELRKLIETSNPENEYFFIVVHSDGVGVSAPTQDSKKVASAITELAAKAPKGNTRLYDAIRISVERLNKPRFENRVLIVLSDGVDTASRDTNYGDIYKLARKENVLFYTINLSKLGDITSTIGVHGEMFLGELSKLSGGRTFYPVTRAKDTSWGKTLGDELRSICFAGIQFVEGQDKPKWREFNVVLSKDAKKRMGDVSLRARKGVYL